MTEHLTVTEVSGQPFAPLEHASLLPQVPATDVKTETSEIMYTDTPRLLSSPTYSAMSASRALSSRHSPAVASAAAQPAAELDGKMCAITPTTQLVWEADADGAQPVADSTADCGHTAAASAALISPGESALQSRVCQLEQQLNQVESRRNSELQELQDIMASLKKKEQELTRFVESQAAAQEQQDELKQAQDQVVQLQYELECSSVKDEEEQQELQAKLQQMEKAVNERGAQIALLQRKEAEAAKAVKQLSEETNAAKAALVQALQASSSKQQLAFLQQQVTVEKSLSNLAADFAGAHTTLQARYLQEAAQRRALHNQLVDLKGAIRVFCRVRPLLAKERAANLEAATSCHPLNNTITVISNRTGRGSSTSVKTKSSTFSYDAVYEPGSSQEAVFSDVEPVVTSVLDGYNVCIFAYGQTGSGKTYTMEGPPGDRGVNYRTLQQLFNTVEARRDETSFTISVSLLEVYMDSINDLLWEEQGSGVGRPKLEVRIGAFGSHLPGLVEKQVNSVEEAWQSLEVGAQSRHSAETKMNERSSRSHCMLCVKVRGQSKLTGDVWRSKLWLVDLAGSERVGKTEAQGERLREAQFINKSLSALGDCIHALATRSAHVPFRNSKLTYVLQDSLSGDSKTLMLVNVNPTDSDAGETACSLGFASRVRGVELGPAKKHIEAGAEVQELKGQLDALRQQMHAVEDDRRRLADKMSATEAAGYSFMADKLAHLEAQLAAKDAQLQTERARVAGLDSSRTAEVSEADGRVGLASPEAMPPPPPSHRSLGVPRTISKALSSAGCAGPARPAASAQSRLEADDSSVSLASSRSGLGRPAGLFHTALKHKTAAAVGAGAFCSTPPSASKKGSWGMTKTGRASPGPTPKPKVAEPGTNFRATPAARVAPSPAFKRMLPSAAASTPLKTAALRTSMAASSGVANSSLTGSAPASHPQLTTAAAAVPSSGFSSRFAATKITDASTSLVNSSLSDAVTQQMVGPNIQLTKQPVLGPATRQHPHDPAETRLRSAGMHAADNTNVASSQHGQSGAGLASADAPIAEDRHAVPSQATDRSLDCGSEATAATEADTHRRTEFGRRGCTHTQQMGDTAARVAFRPASPPFLFEAAAEEDSLVDVGSKADPPDASQSREVDLVARDVVQARLAAGTQADATSQGSHAAPSATLQQQQPASPQTCAASPSAQPQASPQSSWQTHRQLPSTNAAAEPTPSVQQTSESGLHRPASQGLHRLGQGRPVSKTLPVATLAEAAAPGDDDVYGEPGNYVGNSKENEPGVMARAVRGLREGQSRAGRQTAARPPKPITSSKAEYMAKFEQYRKARAEAKPASACSSGQQPSQLTMGAGAARVKAPVKQSSVSLKPERTPLRTSSLQR
ncbi:hypothetical protein WJX77_008530 [Trebouxia sp. C0004]